jgi:zinc protease
MIKHPVRFTHHIIAMIILIAINQVFPAHATSKNSAMTAPAPRVFNAETTTLPNGLQIVVIPNHRAPIVTHMLWIKAGGADEPESESGAAHFLEHLLFKGTAHQAPGEYSRRVRMMGGNDNAFTGQDFTAFFVTIAPEHLPDIMAMERERFLHSAPPPSHFASEHQVIIEERRQRTENDPLGPLQEQMNAYLYASHAYANPIIGWMKDMERLTWENTKAFKDTWYAPNNMILVVSGDVTLPQITALAKKYYGDWPRKAVPPRQRLQAPIQPAITTLTYREPRIRQPQVMMAWRTPPARTNRHLDNVLDVTEEVLSGGTSTKLYQDLVVTSKQASGISLSYSSGALDDNAVWYVGTPSAGVSNSTLQTAMITALKTAANTITDDDVKAAITRMQRQATLARDSVAGPAMIIGQSLSTGQTLDDVETWPQQIATVTKDDVKNAITSLFLCTPGPTCQPPITALVQVDASKISTTQDVPATPDLSGASR